MPRKKGYFDRGVDGQVRFDVLASYDFTCQYCGDSPGNANMHVDHVIPWSKGGSSHLNNLVASCRHCNYGKHDRIRVPDLQVIGDHDYSGPTWKRFGEWTIHAGDYWPYPGSHNEHDGVLTNTLFMATTPWDEGTPYEIDFDRAWNPDWPHHLARKVWFYSPEVEAHFEEAFEFLRSLVRQTDCQKEEAKNFEVWRVNRGRTRREWLHQAVHRLANEANVKNRCYQRTYSLGDFCNGTAERDAEHQFAEQCKALKITDNETKISRRYLNLRDKKRVERANGASKGQQDT